MPIVTRLQAVYSIGYLHFSATLVCAVFHCAYSSKYLALWSRVAAQQNAPSVAQESKQQQFVYIFRILTGKAANVNSKVGKTNITLGTNLVKYNKKSDGWCFHLHRPQRQYTWSS